MPLLEVKDLHTHIVTRKGVNHAVNGVSFTLEAGGTLGIVGESGSGKSMTALSILGLHPKPAARIVGGQVLLDGQNLVGKSEAQMRRVRGSNIAIILQDPLTSLNPLFSVGWQVGEAVHLHQHLTGRKQLDRVIESLRLVQVPSPEVRRRAYPHQLSGGMRQRVQGAIAIASRPKVLIADEATTSLDATIQAQYLDTLRELQQRLNLATIFITHDIGIVATMCDRVAVTYGGRFVEQAAVRDIFNHPAHPYTASLLRAVPKLEADADRLFAIPGTPANGFQRFDGCSFADRCLLAQERCRREKPPVVEVRPGQVSECWRAQELFRDPTLLDRDGHWARTEAGSAEVAWGRSQSAAAPSANGALVSVEDLHVHFKINHGPWFRRESLTLRAVDGVGFAVPQGKTFSLVGESGSGKTTIGRTILGAQEPTAGQVLWRGQDVRTLGGPDRHAFRAAVQTVFQDPYSSMNPRMRVRDFVTEPLLLNTSATRSEREEKAQAALEQAGLRAQDVNLYPHEFSGGQRQRIAIARALVSSPKIIVLDEPVSSLDPSIRAQIMNLLRDLQQDLGLSYLFIAHHLGTVRYMGGTVGVLYLGQLMEQAPAEALFSQPAHPYTKALISAALSDHPDVERERILLRGDVSGATEIPTGCRLHPRCPYALPKCAEVEPEWKEIEPGRWTACHLY